MEELKPRIECRRCHDPKLEDEFGTYNGRRNPICKECCAAAVRKCYATNISYREAMKAGAERRALRNHRFLFAYLKEHPCVDCGETDPLILQFDHVTEGTKVNDVTGFIECSIARLLKEIAICVVRCGNCHLKKTAKAFNTIRYQLCLEAEKNGMFKSMEILLAEEMEARKNHPKNRFATTV